MKLTHENLEGSWIVAGSEIDHVEPGDEIYHFMPPDRFVIEFKQPNGRWYQSKQRYALTEDGFAFGREGNLRCAVTAWLQSGFLSFRPNHGKQTWSTRMTDKENQAEQGVAPQSATCSGTKSESNDKPQPESEGRSR
jgi:hypothetical protein